MQIPHQFKNSDYFLPNWPIKTLVLGTFNPACGQPTDYFYGRRSNNFWRAIECVEGKEKFFYQDNFSRKLKTMSALKFGCTDIISSVKIDSLVKDKICGKGYSDSILFTQKYVEPRYEFEGIKQFIAQRRVQKVIHTWGKRQSPQKLFHQIKDLELFCEKNGILFIKNSPSPSGRLKNNMPELITFYKEHLF